ncbi:MAG: NUDIX domain-containing protein [Candidatus Eisenbacteria bacterium]|nr:NUDIX domain-containing protein [Candidatus Eisenbacteria bacterium]
MSDSETPSFPHPSGYLGWIRSHVGREPILLVYATAIVRDRSGRVLFQRRADFPIWGLPGGILEPGETLIDALRREAREETGYEVRPVRFVGLYSSPDYTVHYPNGDAVQQVTGAFECEIEGGSGEPDGDESLEQIFLPIDSAPPLFPWYDQMLADVRAGSPATRFDAGSPSGPNPHPEGIVRWLRSHVGAEPILMPCASAIVQDGLGRVLLIRRGDSGLWALPAGSMEMGERIDGTAVREVEEETGLIVRATRLTGFYAGLDHWSVYPNGDQVWLAVACFLCEIEGGTLRADGVESTEVGFFGPEELPLDHEPWGPRTRRRIQDALERGPEAVAG